jgi:hypothetical protein
MSITSAPKDSLQIRPDSRESRFKGGFRLIENPLASRELVHIITIIGSNVPFSRVAAKPLTGAGDDRDEASARRCLGPPGGPEGTSATRTSHSLPPTADGRWGRAGFDSARGRGDDSDRPRTRLASWRALLRQASFKAARNPSHLAGGPMGGPRPWAFASLACGGRVPR